MVIFNIHDPEKYVQYKVSVSTNLYLETCEEEWNYVNRQDETARSFQCTQFFDANFVGISNKDSTMPLTLCEVAIYTTGKKTTEFDHSLWKSWLYNSLFYVIVHLTEIHATSQHSV